MDRITKFSANNNCIKAENKEGKLIINNCWNDSSIRFEFSNEEDLSYLDNIVLPKELFAIFHKEANIFEFIFLPLSEEYKRSFDYIFCGQTYKLYYGPPTHVCKELASHVLLNDTADINERAYGMLRYSQYYAEEDSNQEPLFPTNFFIEGDFTIIPFEKQIDFFRHVNFMMSYYDRQSPRILIYNETEENISDIKT